MFRLRVRSDRRRTPGGHVRSAASGPQRRCPLRDRRRGPTRIPGRARATPRNDRSRKRRRSPTPWLTLPLPHPGPGGGRARANRSEASDERCRPHSRTPHPPALPDAGNAPREVVFGRICNAALTSRPSAGCGGATRGSVGDERAADDRFWHALSPGTASPRTRPGPGCRTGVRNQCVVNCQLVELWNECVLVGELLGYARVSTPEQDAALQHDALSAAGCFRTWTDTASGAVTDRPELGGGDGCVAPGGHFGGVAVGPVGSVPAASDREHPGPGGAGGGVSVAAGGDRHHDSGGPVGVPHLRLPGGVLCYLDTPRGGGVGSGAGPW
jgi:hypothetical protein